MASLSFFYIAGNLCRRYAKLTLLGRLAIRVAQIPLWGDDIAHPLLDLFGLGEALVSHPVPHQHAIYQNTELPLAGGHQRPSAGGPHSPADPPARL